MRGQAETEAGAPEHQAARVPPAEFSGRIPTYISLCPPHRSRRGRAAPPLGHGLCLGSGRPQDPRRGGEGRGRQVAGNPPRGCSALEARAQACLLSVGCAPMDQGGSCRQGGPHTLGHTHRPLHQPPAPTWRTTPMTGRFRVCPGAGAGHWSISLQTVDIGGQRQRPGLEQAAQRSRRELQPGRRSGPTAPAGHSPASRQGASLSKNSGATRPSSAWNSRTKGRRDSSTSDCRARGPVRRCPSPQGPGRDPRAQLSRAAQEGHPTGFLGQVSQEQPNERLQVTRKPPSQQGEPEPRPSGKGT